MAYLIAAIELTLNVLEGHFLYRQPFPLRYFVFVACHTVPLYLQCFL